MIIHEGSVKRIPGIDDAVNQRLRVVTTSGTVEGVLDGVVRLDDHEILVFGEATVRSVDLVSVEVVDESTPVVSESSEWEITAEEARESVGQIVKVVLLTGDSIEGSLTAVEDMSTDPQVVGPHALNINVGDEIKRVSLESVVDLVELSPPVSELTAEDAEQVIESDSDDETVTSDIEEVGSEVSSTIAEAFGIDEDEFGVDEDEDTEDLLEDESSLQ